MFQDTQELKSFANIVDRCLVSNVPLEIVKLILEYQPAKCLRCHRQGFQNLIKENCSFHPSLKYYDCTRRKSYYLCCGILVPKILVPKISKNQKYKHTQSHEMGCTLGGHILRDYTCDLCCMGHRRR